MSVALRDGSRVDECQLVSLGRNRNQRVWLFCLGADVFVALSDVVDMWEPAAVSPRQAA